MAQKKKGLIARILEGKERSDDYVRSKLPTNRWQLFFDIFKNNFWKIVRANLLTLIFFVPMIVVIVVYSMLVDMHGAIYPFGANLGVGYPAVPRQQGIAEMLAIQDSLLLYGGIAFSSIIAAIGLAGGMYVVRNMVWTEGIFVTNDFWRGVKLNFKNALQAALFFCVVLLLCGMLIAFADFSLATMDISKWQRMIMQSSRITSYVLIAFAAMMTLWMISLGVNYQLTFFTMLRNSFLMTIGTLVQTIFFGALALLPVILLLISSGLFFFLALVVGIMFGVAYALLVWLNFSQWVFDKFINPKIKGAKVGRGIYNKDGTSTITGEESAAEREYQRTILAHGKSRLIARPIKPIDDSLQVYELPTSFSREDLKRLRESKQNIIDDTEAYEKEHQNDSRYVEYNKQFEEREKALQEDEQKRKKRKPPRLLGE